MRGTRGRPFAAVLAALALAWGGVGLAGAAPSAIGLTGGLTVPSPVTLKPETYEFGLHVEGFTEQSTVTHARETVGDLSLKLNVGIYDNLEVGVEKTLRTASDLRDEQVTLQAKYRLPVESFNLSLGTCFATGVGDWHSAYLVAGWKALYAGVGLNFGGDRLEEIALGTYRQFGTAKFGGYGFRKVVNELNQVTYVGEPDEFFALFGVDFKLSDYFQLLADYNGDRFSAGFRINLKDLNLDLAYVSQSESDGLLSRNTMHFQFGTGIKF